jgi:hypothetical protein
MAAATNELTVDANKWALKYDAGTIKTLPNVTWASNDTQATYVNAASVLTNN